MKKRKNKSVSYEELKELHLLALENRKNSKTQEEHKNFDAEVKKLEQQINNFKQNKHNHKTQKTNQLNKGSFSMENTPFNDTLDYKKGWKFNPFFYRK